MEIYIPTAAPVACSIIVSVSNVAEADFIIDDLPLADVIPGTQKHCFVQMQFPQKFAQSQKTDQQIICLPVLYMAMCILCTQMRA